MPTLRFGKVWQVIRHFGVLFFCDLGTPKTIISNFITTRQIETPYSSPCEYDHPNDVTMGQKIRRTKKSWTKMYLFPSSTQAISRLLFMFFGCLRVPPQRCNLMVPADWGWGCCLGCAFHWNPPESVGIPYARASF